MVLASLVFELGGWAKAAPPVHRLHDASSLLDKALREREVGPTFLEQRLPVKGEIRPHGGRNRGRLHEPIVWITFGQRSSFCRGNTCYGTADVRNSEKSRQGDLHRRSITSSMETDVAGCGERMLAEIFVAASLTFTRERLATVLFILFQSSTKPCSHFLVARVFSKTTIDDLRNAAGHCQKGIEVSVERSLPPCVEDDARHQSYVHLRSFRRLK